jgi:hypothetical protein
MRVSLSFPSGPVARPACSSAPARLSALGRDGTLEVGADPLAVASSKSTASFRAALAPPRGARRSLGQTLVRGLAVASVASAGVGALPLGLQQQAVVGPRPATPGEDLFAAYLGDWRCVTYGEGRPGDAWTKFTTPPSWYRNAVEIWWDDLDAEWRRGFLVYVDPVDATHAQGSGPWLKKRHDNGVLPTWGNAHVSAEKTRSEGWDWVVEVKLNHADDHWIERHTDTFDATGAFFKRDRRVHRLDQDGWHNDTVLCTLLPAGPRI